MGVEIREQQDKLLELFSDDQLFDLAQDCFGSDWETCWRILRHIKKSGDLLRTDGPSYEQMYGECLRQKLNDPFHHKTWQTDFEIPDEIKEKILIELFDNLNFKNRPTPISALLRHHLELREMEETLEPDWPWPITSIPSDNGGGPFGSEFANASALKILGYSVGVKGLVDAERKELLERFFTGPLPSIVSELFADAWGNPGSEERLKKMADTISSNCKNFKRNDAERYSVAIKEWDEDLGWLREKFYKRGKFPWPDTYVD